MKLFAISAVIATIVSSQAVAAPMTYRLSLNAEGFETIDGAAAPQNQVVGSFLFDFDPAVSTPIEGVGIGAVELTIAGFAYAATNLRYLYDAAASLFVLGQAADGGIVGVANDRNDIALSIFGLFSPNFQNRTFIYSVPGGEAYISHDVAFTLEPAPGSLPVPEPAMLGLIGLGMVGVAAMRRRGIA